MCSEDGGVGTAEEMGEHSGGGRAQGLGGRCGGYSWLRGTQTYLLSMLPLTMRLGGLSLRLTHVKSPSALPSFERQRSASRLYTRIWGGRRCNGPLQSRRLPSNTCHCSVAQGSVITSAPIKDGLPRSILTFSR